MEPQLKSSGIIALTVSNLLRIKLAEVRPDGSAVIVAGRNDQGKTSLLNSIAIALSGKNLPEQPLRKGSTKGYVVLETAEFIITRSFTANGQSLEVRDAEGRPVTSPQSKLDALVQRVTFDPFEFTRMEPAKQLATVRRLVNLDFTALDAEHATKYAARTEANRKARDQETRLKDLVRYAEAPAEPVSVTALAAKLTQAQEANKANDAKREELDAVQETLDEADRKHAASEKALSEAEQIVIMRRQELKLAQARCEEATARRDTMKQEIVELQDVDTAAILAEISSADEVNKKVTANANWREQHQLLNRMNQESQDLTDRLDEIDKEKKALLEAVKFPVQGLGFGECGVTYNGVPFEQAGSAIKIRTSVAIARSLAPKLPVMLIRDGSLLDPDSHKVLLEEAQTHGLQIWMEVVGARDDATVVIEDGEVIDRPAQKKKTQQPA